MRDIARDAERARRELSAMGMEHIRVNHALEGGVDQPDISVHCLVSYAEDNFDPQSVLAEAERAVRLIDEILPGYRRERVCMVGVKGAIQVSVGYEIEVACVICANQSERFVPVDTIDVWYMHAALGTIIRITSIIPPKVF